MASVSDSSSAADSARDELALLRALCDSLPDAIVVAGADGRIVKANPAAANLLGYSIEELARLNVDDLVPDSIRPRHATYRSHYGKHPLQRPMGKQMELVAKRADGSEVMVEIGLSPVTNLGKSYVVAAIRDIAAYPRMKQALRRARYSEHLAQWGQKAVDTRDMLALIPQVTLTATEALQLEVAELYLLEPDQLVFLQASRTGPIDETGQRLNVPNLPDSPEGFVMTQAAPVIVPAFAMETRFTVPPTYLASGLTSGLFVPVLDHREVIGVLSVLSKSSFPFGDDEVRFLQSLSNLLATTLQRAQSEDALNHAQRLESVGQLTGGIAHDFNNLLTVIQGNLQVLEELPEIAAAPGAQDLLSAAARASRRGAELTSKLLAFSRRQVLQPAPVDVHTMLHSLADMLRRTLDQRIVIDLDSSTECSQVMADPGQLESALLNIAINARDAMPDGGTLSFSASACATLPPEALGTPDDVAPSGRGFVAIRVSDSGIGMPEAVKERAFEPFFTTKGAGRGTGLGLSTVYGFVKQSKGAITIDSAPNLGCTVTLYIPTLTEARPTPAESALHPIEIPDGLRVLLVEDDGEVRMAVKRYLGQLHCDVIETRDGEEALRSLANGMPPDLLLTDIALGSGMRGTELAAQVQTCAPTMRVLLTSGYSSEMLDADRGAPPAWELLRKPYSREELAAAISRAMKAG